MRSWDKMKMERRRRRKRRRRKKKVKIILWMITFFLPFWEHASDLRVIFRPYLSPQTPGHMANCIHLTRKSLPVLRRCRPTACGWRCSRRFDKMLSVRGWLARKKLRTKKELPTTGRCNMDWNVVLYKTREISFHSWLGDFWKRTGCFLLRKKRF